MPSFCFHLVPWAPGGAGRCPAACGDSSSKGSACGGRRRCQIYLKRPGSPSRAGSTKNQPQKQILWPISLHSENFSGTRRRSRTYRCLRKKAADGSLTLPRRPPSPIFQCCQTRTGECKPVRNKSLVLLKTFAECVFGNIEIWGTGADVAESDFRQRLLFRKHRY